jgi:hypothetical protein
MTTQESQVVCPQGKDTLMPDRSNCSNYIKCVSGKATVKYCPPGMLFDSFAAVCFQI